VIKEDTANIREHINEMHSGVDRLEREKDHAKHIKFTNWISTTDYPAQQCDLIQRKQEGTGQWFLNTLEVASWLDEPKGTLFCRGDPGTGKTMIAAIMIDHLMNIAKRDGYGVAFVYCNYRVQAQQDVQSILAAILTQLVQRRPTIITHIAQLQKQFADNITKPSLPELCEALQSIVAHLEHVYIIIDALDESRTNDRTRDDLVAQLRKLREFKDVRIMVTSRRMPEIQNHFPKATTVDIRADLEDLKRFVAGQIYRLRGCIQHNPELRNEVQNKISEAADGMYEISIPPGRQLNNVSRFLLARLHVDSLLDKFTVKAVKSTLSQLSRGSKTASETLNIAYSEAIQRIENQPPGNLTLARRVISWITFAKRPLKITELCCALAVEPDTSALDPDNITNYDDLVSVCAGLVVVDQESEVIRLVHYTTQEYFERICRTWTPTAPLEIASTCLMYLCFDVFEGELNSWDQCKRRSSENLFFDYATIHLVEHLKAVEFQVSKQACSTFLMNDSLVSCTEQAIEYYCTKESLHLITQYVEERDCFSIHYGYGMTGIHFTARHGLGQLLEGLLRGRQEEDIVIALNTKDGLGVDPLGHATQFGHHTAVRILLDNGARVHLSTIINASVRGDEQILELLLNKRDHDFIIGEEAVETATSRKGNYVFELPPEAPPNLNNKSDLCSAALPLAAYASRERTCKMLLNAGADANTEYHSSGTQQLLHGRNVLETAAMRGHERVVKLLLDSGADANAPSWEVQTRGVDNEQLTNLLVQDEESKLSLRRAQQHMESEHIPTERA
jgi:DNA replication protein DnaC